MSNISSILEGLNQNRIESLNEAKEPYKESEEGYSKKAKFDLFERNPRVMSYGEGWIKDAHVDWTGRDGSLYIDKGKVGKHKVGDKYDGDIKIVGFYIPADKSGFPKSDTYTVILDLGDGEIGVNDVYGKTMIDI